MYAVVNIYNEPTSDTRYPSYTEAEVKVKSDWAAGWETYVALDLDNQMRQIASDGTLLR